MELENLPPIMIFQVHFTMKVFTPEDNPVHVRMAC